MSNPPHDPFFDPFSPGPAPPTGPFGPPAARPLPPPRGGTAPAAPPPVHGRPPHAFPTPPPVRAPGSPAAVFGGSWALGGIAALLASAAIAALASIPSFRAQQGSPPGPLLVGGAAALVVLAAAVVSLSVLDERGRGWARIASWAVCGAGVAAAAAVLAFDPARSVAWLARLLQVGAVMTVIVSVAAAVLLALPPSNAYFHGKTQAKPGPSQRHPQPPPAFAQPPAAPAPPSPSRMPSDDHDFDPFS